MYTIGLTGGIGAGKTFVSEIFMRYGIPSVDTDKISRQICEIGQPCLQEITNNFKDTILNSDGSLNRKKLAEIVFNDEQKLRILNDITHKYILKECREQMRKYEMDNYFAVLIDAPLLFESGFNKYCDYVISVVADTDIRINRVLKRDNMTESEVLRRINNQHDNRFFIFHSDFVIYNNPHNDPELQINIIYQQLRWV